MRHDGLSGHANGALPVAPGLAARVSRAMAYGTIVASFNIEAFSLGRLMQISRADIDKRLAEYRGDGGGRVGANAEI